jgi:tetratricopeptide (TPR) repeat protein
MKRFPFFYDISNWLVPFFMQHPDIAPIADRLGENKFLNGILTKGPFCNSDKYSFVIAFQQVMGNLPENVARLMSRGEVQPAEFEEEELQQPAYIRRSYLMDLYRFFRLFPNRAALCNPFDNSKQQLGMCLFFASELFCHTPLEKQKPEVVAMLRKKGLLQAADTLLKSFPEDMRDVQYYLWTEQFDVVLEMDPNHEKALAHCARKLFEEGNFGEAVDIYDRLLLLRADKASYMLNKAVCLVKLEEYEDALKLLYQLDYEHGDDANIQRVFAWALTCDGKLEQADKVYTQLIAAQQATAEDYLNQGYCLWLMKRIDDAVESFRKYIELTPAEQRNDPLFDFFWLKNRGVDIIQFNMMIALVQG